MLQNILGLIKTDVVLKFRKQTITFPLYIRLIKTDVVLKSSCLESPRTAYKFNKNRCCIEIFVPLIYLILPVEFNKNRCCIEIMKYIKQWAEYVQFNKNRCCIEMPFDLLVFHPPISLIKTDVVLKSSCHFSWIKVCHCLIKTDVVLKCYVFYYAIKQIKFNKNRCCIEIRQLQ